MTDPSIPIHLLHLSTQMSWRGGEQQIAYLMEELGPRPIHQTIACPLGSEMAAHCQKMGLSFVCFAPVGSFNLRLPFFLRRRAGERGINLVHAHDSHALNHALMAHCIGLKAPIVVNRRVDFPVRSRFKYNHPAVKRIICDSETIRRVMADCLGRGDKLVTVHSGIDVDRFTGRQSQGILRRDFGIPPDCRLIGNVAALADHKGYPTFIDTAEILLNQDGKLRFLIIGEGPQRAEIEARISQKNLQERIFITGFRSDIPDILPELDLFLITSKTEGLGTSIIEAMAARVPVVATAAGGIPELITDNLTGLLAPVGDSRALAAAALRVLREAGLKERLVAKALGVPPRFDKKEIGRKTWDIYQTIMS